MPSRPWNPTKLKRSQIRFLKAQEEKGKHIGFQNLANIIYTNELQRHTPERAADIARKTAGMQAVKLGVHKGTKRHHIPVLR